MSIEKSQRIAASRFSDTWGSTVDETAALFTRRSSELQEVLQREISITPTLVLELGSGTGAGIAALHRLFPETSIISVDEDALAAAAARKLGVTEHYTNLPSDLGSIIQNDALVLVTAFRCPAELLLQLLVQLQELESTSRIHVLFTFIPTSEPAKEVEIEKLVPRLWRFQRASVGGLSVQNRFVVHEGRDYSEWGAVLKMGNQETE